MENKKLEELLSNEKFKAKIKALDSDEEIKALFAENGIEVEIENTVEGELGENELEDVAGGRSITQIWRCVRIGSKRINILPDNTYDIIRSSKNSSSGQVV